MGTRDGSELETEPDFEELYVAAGDDLQSIPWAELTAHPALITWLDGDAATSARAALVVGCGFGDDAEALAARGYDVTAFDIAPTAIDRCRRRFPGSTVDYRVADLLALPAEWQRSFETVVEIRTLQSLSASQRPAAVSAIAGTVRASGRLFVRCLARGDQEPVGARPWPVSPAELAGFTAAGLTEVTFREDPPAGGRARTLTAVYERREQVKT